MSSTERAPEALIENSVGMALAPAGAAALLVPIHYPIQAAGRVMACWLGDTSVADARRIFEDAGAADYATPEEAVADGAEPIGRAIKALERFGLAVQVESLECTGRDFKIMTALEAKGAKMRRASHQNDLEHGEAKRHRVFLSDRGDRAGQLATLD